MRRFSFQPRAREEVKIFAERKEFLSFQPQKLILSRKSVERIEYEPERIISLYKIQW